MENKSETKHVFMENNEPEEMEIQLEVPSLYFSKRFAMAFLIFVGVIFLVALRINFSMALVEMTSVRNLSSNNITEQIVEFDWNSRQQAFSLSAFSYGFLFCPFGGIIASRYGGVTVFGVGITVTALSTLITPLLVRLNFYLFVLSRVTEGVFEACAMCSIPEIWSRWAPPEERGILFGLVIIGMKFGSTLIFPLAGIIAKKWGWPAIFYVTGSLPLLWSVIWFAFVRNDPALDEYISKKEQLYLKVKINRQVDDKVKYAWKSIMTSRPVWAICIAKIAFSGAYTFEYLYLPKYIKDRSNVDIDEIGFISALPHLLPIFGIPIISIFADYLRNSGKMTATQVHKLYFGIGSFGIALLYIAIIFSNVVESVVVISLQALCISGVGVMFGVINLDLAPRSASVLFGISNLFFVLGTILYPTLFGYVVTTHSLSEWNTCFVVLSAASLIGGIFFFIFGSGELQSWSLSPEEKHALVAFIIQVLAYQFLLEPLNKKDEEK